MKLYEKPGASAEARFRDVCFLYSATPRPFPPPPRRVAPQLVLLRPEVCEQAASAEVVLTCAGTNHGSNKGRTRRVG